MYFLKNLGYISRLENYGGILAATCRRDDDMIDYGKYLKEIGDEVSSLENPGKVASYIPQLSVVDPDKFGIHLRTIDGKDYSYGDSDVRFSIQSVSKVFTLALAFELEGPKLWERVGVEPSGTPFNSLVQLEYEKGIPRNPFINAGALVVCDVIVSHFHSPKLEMIELIRKLAGNPLIDYSSKVADSELGTSYRNCALINLMKDYGNIKNKIATVLDLYCYLCSIEMSCRELAQSFQFLANAGVNPLDDVRVIDVSKSKRINAIMQTCGFYDESGEFTFKVGLPGKSGVGGGVAAVHPGEYSIALWSPKLNKKGNSWAPMKVLELFTTATERSIF